MRKLIFKKSYLIFALLILFVVIPIAGWSSVFSPSWGLNGGESYQMKNIYYQECTMINNTGTKYFVPDNSGTEWEAFRAFARNTNYVNVGCRDDGVCDTAVNNEDCSTAPEDCGYCATYCGNYVCENGENVYNCPNDCSSGCYGPGYCSTYTIELRCLKNPAEGCSWGTGGGAI